MAERLFHLLDESLFEENHLSTLPNGRHVMKVTPTGSKILAHVAEGKITKYDIEDAAGKPLPVLFMTETIPEDEETDIDVLGITTCRVCEIGADGVVHCWRVPC